MRLGLPQKPDKPKGLQAYLPKVEQIVKWFSVLHWNLKLKDS